MTDVKVPAVGESVTEVTITTWLKSDGDSVEMDEVLCELESDKASVELPAESAGVLSIKAQEGDTVEIGAVIASIDESQAGAGPSKPKEEKAEEKPQAEAASASAPASDKTVTHASPAAQKILAEKGMSAGDVSGSGREGRVTKGDALQAQAPTNGAKAEVATQVQFNTSGSREIRREKMSSLRKTIAKVLVEAKNTTAMLTTFNEVNMKPVMDLRKRYKEEFKEKYGIGLGFMSLFSKAACLALKEWPSVNGQIEGNEIVYHDYVDLGIAVSTPKGLVVPVVRNAESMGLAQIEQSIKNVALKGRDGKLSIDEMKGGTFTITNGGVFGSMLSTPILNRPQSAILGMHNIVERPWVENGEVVIRPIMYLALSYDHRIVDGRESVSCLKMIKDLLEDPARMLLGL